MNKMKGVLAGFLASLSAALTAAAAPETAADQGWEAVQNLMFAEALTLFRNSPAGDRQSVLSLRLGEAVAILHRQPTTRKNIDAAQAIFDELIREAPGTDTSLQAAYLKARVTQLHPFEPDPAAAIPLYLEVTRRYPETVLGQFAYVKASGLQLYDPETADEDRPFEAISVNAFVISNPDVLRCYHLMMAEASHRLGYDDAFSLKHYIEAYEAGLTKPDLEANVLTRIIVLSQRLGDTETARACAERFLTEFPRDIRVTMIGELLTELDKADS
jgi:hypothetical protein